MILRVSQQFFQPLLPRHATRINSTKPLPMSQQMTRYLHSDALNKYIQESYLRETYEELKPKLSKPDTNFLQKLGNAKKLKISEKLDVLTSGTPVGSSITDLATNVIFVRSYYDHLLRTIRSFPKAVLIGNPGIGKSWFQFYYLARIMRPDLFGPLPPDYEGNCEPPKVVIRQIADVRMLVYFLEEKQVEVVQTAHPSVIQCFDPKTSLYLFEPEKSKIEPHYYGLSIPTLATVSPDESRYHEFVKNKAMKLFMPVWNLPELLSVGKFLRDNKLVPEGVDYSDERIGELYVEFGGILRYVFPFNLMELSTVRRKRKREIDSANAQYILAMGGDIEDPQVSHLLLQYKVTTSGKDAFLDYKFDFVNLDIVESLEKKIFEVSVDDIVNVLRRNDECPGQLETACPKLYEALICKLLVKGVSNWETCNRNTGSTKKQGVWEPLEQLKMRQVIEGKIPKFKEIQSDVVYHSLNSKFPAFDLLFKRNNKLICIQVTTQKKDTKKISKNSWDDFLESLDVQPKDIIPVLCPRPTLADTAKLDIDYDQPIDYAVWRLPKYYTHE